MEDNSRDALEVEPQFFLHRECAEQMGLIATWQEFTGGYVSRHLAGLDDFECGGCFEKF